MIFQYRHKDGYQRGKHSTIVPPCPRRGPRALTKLRKNRHVRGTKTALRGFIKYGHWRGPTEGLEEPHKSWSVVGTCRYLVVFYGSIDTLGHLGAGCHTFYTPVRHYTDTRQISRKDRLYPIRDRTRDLPMRSLARCHSTTDSPPLAESGVA